MDRIELSSGVVEVTPVSLPDGSAAKELELPSGTARVRVAHVPPMMVTDIIRGRADLSDIPKPMVKVGGIGDKWVHVRPGQKEYHDWEAAQDERDKLRGEAQDDMMWNYAVVEWMLPGSDKWVDEPPKGWKLSKRATRLGAKARSGVNGRRVDYLRCALAVTNSDVEAIQFVMYGMTSSILKAEADAVAKIFQDHEDESGDPATPA